MRKSVRFLLYPSRAFAILAILLGLASGFLEATLSWMTCFDSCPQPWFVFSALASRTMFSLAPCVALETLALLLFLAHCAVTRQPRRAIVVVLLGVIVGLSA